jgi:hypothetical protein
MEDQTYKLCPHCESRVDPNEADVVYAVEQHEVTAMGPTRTIVDGLGGYFHAACSPEAVGYARRQRPADTSAA